METDYSEDTNSGGVKKKFSEETIILARRGGYSLPEKDPLRGYKGIVSAILLLEMITIFLSIPIAVQLSPSPVPVVGVVWVIVWGILCFGLCTKVSRSWLWWAVLVIQLGLILSWWVHISVPLIGFIFSTVWIYTWTVGRLMKAKIQTGELYGQKPLHNGDAP